MRVLVGIAFGICLAGSAAAQDSPRELYQELNALRVDASRVYYVHDLNLRRRAVSVTFVEGKLAFFAPLAGRVTGAVFTGRGRVIATPRDPAEKQSLARFLGVPLLDQTFSSAYLRFTDEASAELLRQLETTGAEPTSEPGFAEHWDPTLMNLNPWHSQRVMADWLATHPQPYFYAGLTGDAVGPFGVLVDPRREETVLIGQPRQVGGVRFYDVWASFPASAARESLPEVFVPLGLVIDTTIADELSLQGKTTLRIKALRDGERMLSLELSRLLQVQSVTDGGSQPLAFFQNEEMSREEILRHGNNSVLVVLARPSRAGEEFELQFAYRGSVISDAGNGVYFVGERGSWYPHLSGPDHFVPFELTFRWPRRLTLVTTGARLEERVEGDTRVGRWRSSQPIALAGFNLGEYATQTVGDAKLKIELCANHQLESAIVARMRQQPSDFSAAVPLLPQVFQIDPDHTPQVVPEIPPPSPAAVLKQLGDGILDSIHFFEKLNGPFPFERLEVSQIPGSFGQGWPGLLYLPTLVFLPPEAQKRTGITRQTQEQVTELVPFHEVAHQWWGNVVGVASYRDTWIQEAMANYLALLYADSRKPSEHVLANWLERYRAELMTKEPGAENPVEQAGPLSTGYRLSSSRSPGAYDAVIYGKGTWVMHMLRMMLREPAAKNPDARFAGLLQSVLAEHRYQPLATADFQHAVEQVMTPAMDLEGNHSMDWFFDEWVRQSGIPRFAVQFHTRPNGKDFLIRGTLKQTGVPELFTAAVPLYASRAGGKPALLGSVVTTGPETTFHFVSRFPPRRIVIDPQLTLLCHAE